MEKFKKIFDKILSTVCELLLGSMVIMVTYQVIARYVFKAPSSVTEVLTRYAFIWLILVSATYVFGHKDHIAITFLKDKLTGLPKKVCNIIVELLTIAFSATVFLYGGVVITKMNLLQFDSILGIPTGVIYSIIPICGVLIIIYSIFNIIDYCSNKKLEEGVE